MEVFKKGLFGEGEGITLAEGYVFVRRNRFHTTALMQGQIPPQCSFLRLTLHLPGMGKHHHRSPQLQFKPPRRAACVSIPIEATRDLK